MSAKKRVRRLVAGALMAIAMAGQFVAAGDDAPHQVGIAFGHPAQGEEGGVDAVLGQHGQDALDVAFRPGIRAASHSRARDVRRERRDLEIVLDVDRSGRW